MQICYFNPEKPEEITQSLVKIERDKILRRRLIEKGFNLVKKFTWENSTKRLVKVFEEIIIKQT